MTDPIFLKFLLEDWPSLKKVLMYNILICLRKINWIAKNNKNVNNDLPIHINKNEML